MDDIRRQRILEMVKEAAAAKAPNPLPEKDRKYPLWKILGAAGASSAAGALTGHLAANQIRKLKNLPPQKFGKIHKGMLAAAPMLALSGVAAKHYANKEVLRLSSVPKDKDKSK